jgi:NAD(P)-dependent dehydrogenase (short-subunit alcohol dehydrogenase family)
MPETSHNAVRCQPPRATFGGLDALVNNAGASGPTKPVEDVTDEKWNRTLAVNVTGQFHAVRAAVPLFRAGRRRCHQHIVSRRAHRHADAGPYSTSKYAVLGSTDGLAAEPGGRNVRVHAIMPGLVHGPRGWRVMEISRPTARR